MNLNGIENEKGILVDEDFVLGVLKMSGKRGDVMGRDAEGNVTDEVKKMKYDLRSQKQGMMIQVGIPADAPIKDIPRGAKVRLVNPVFGAVASQTFGTNAKVDWFINADNIVEVDDLTLKPKTPAGNEEGKHQEPRTDKK